MWKMSLIKMQPVANHELLEPVEQPLATMMSILRRQYQSANRQPNRQHQLQEQSSVGFEAERAQTAGPFYSNGAQVANYEQEMGKLLRCTYSGLSNLFKCEPNA